MFSQRLFYPFFALAILGAITLASFQNCQEAAPPQPRQAASSTPDTPMDPGDPGQPVIPQGLRIRTEATPHVSVDCSSPQASFTWVIENASADLRACLWHRLIMPGFDRDGEIAPCAEDGEWARLNDRFPWMYDAATRTWSYFMAVSQSGFLVPGDFELIVQEPGSSERVRSDTVRIRRDGAENCKP